MPETCARLSVPSVERVCWPGRELYPWVKLLRENGLLALALGLGRLLGLGGHVSHVRGRIGGGGALQTRDSVARILALHHRSHNGELLHAHGLGALARAVRLAHEGLVGPHARLTTLAGALAIGLAEEGAVGAHGAGVLKVEG